MRFATASAVLIAATAAACEPAPQPQPNEMEAVVNATRTDRAAPAGALGNDSVNVAEDNITPAERDRNAQQQQQQAGSAAGVVEQFANLIVQRRFEEAYQLWDPQAGISAEQLARRFERFETMQAALRDESGPQGAAGSVYNEVQLTISGTRKDGSNYTVTGPVTLKRANDVPGSTAEQRRWRIVKMVLTSNPQAADALVDQ